MLLKGDCIEVMKAMKPNSVDAIVTDPPYGLEFMGKEWDKLGWDTRNIYNSTTGLGRYLNKERPRYQIGIQAQLWHTQWLTEAYRVLKPGGSMLVMGGTRTSHRLACAIEDSGFIIKDTLMWIYGSGFPKAQDLGKMIDKRAGKERKVMGENIRLGDKKAYPYNATSQIYGKDNDHLRGGMRPPVTAPSTNLARYWNGFKVGGIKPAYEPIIWAVKPPEGSYVDNVLKWGVGAVNVDECRVNCKNLADKREAENKNRHADFKSGARENKIYGEDNRKRAEQGNYSISKGRFPANIILSHHPECVQVGVKKAKVNDREHIRHNNPNEGTVAKGQQYIHKTKGYADPGGYETVESWDCHPDCAVRMLDEQSKGQRAGKPRGGKTIHTTFKDAMFNMKGEQILNGEHLNDNGGASRFFYCAKASRGERNAGLDDLPDKLHGQSGGATQALKEGKSEYIQKDHIGLNKIKRVKNNHPTVKPIKLFEWLIKLVTREGQIILDPFIGSGTTAIATHNADRKCIGIEKEDEYIEIAKRRVLYWQNQPIQQQLALGEGAS